MNSRVTAAVPAVIALLLLIAVILWMRRGRNGDVVVTANPSLAAELRRDVEALCAIRPRNPRSRTRS